MTRRADGADTTDRADDAAAGSAAADSSAAGSAAGDSSATPAGGAAGRADKMPMRMLNDRILVKLDAADEERRSAGGILIPATAQIGKRLAWAEVRAAGPNVRAVQEGDHVLFNPEDVYEVEVRAETFIILRERDIHAVAAERLEEGHTGLYL